jgi:hypothetical protein
MSIIGVGLRGCCILARASTSQVALCRDCSPLSHGFNSNIVCPARLQGCTLVSK